MRSLLFFIIMHIVAGPLFGKERRTIYVTTEGGKAFYRGRTISTEEFLTGIKKAKSGDQVIILPGTYHGRYVIGQRADPNNPIIISGVAGLTIFACGDLPENRGDSPFKFSVAQGLVFENVRFESCWPSSIEVTDSSYLTFRQNTFIGGHNAFRIAEQSTHSIAILDSTWIQDTTKKELWTSNTASVKKGSKLEDYHGAFIHTNGVLGNLIIKNNFVSHSFSIFACTSEPRHRLPTTNVLLQENKVNHLRGEFINVNCAIENLEVSNNIIDQFGLMMNNQGSISQALVAANVFAGGGGDAPNYILANKGALNGLTFAHNTVSGVNHFFAFGNKGSFLDFQLLNNVIQLTEEKPNWQDSELSKDITISHNLVNRQLPKGRQKANHKVSPLEFGSGNSAYQVKNIDLVRNKGRRFTNKNHTASFTGSAPDIGAYEDDQLIAPPRVSWHPIRLAADILILDQEINNGFAQFQLSGKLKAPKSFKLMAYTANNKEEITVDCQNQAVDLMLTCKLPKEAIPTIGFGTSWLEEHNLKLWPSTTNLVTYDDDKTENEKAIGN